MSRRIFLSYRGSDSASATGRLSDAIRHRFGAESVYMDTSSMAWGEQWPTALERAVGAAIAIRDRAAEVLRGSPALVPVYAGDLRWHARSDRNPDVRRMARAALRRGART